MKHKIWISLLGLLVLPFLVSAEVIDIQVDGMVCAFCAQRIESSFNKQEAVDRVDVNLSERTVTLFIREGKSLSEEVIAKITRDSGYKLRALHRRP
ncbi:MAG: copper chaperone [Bradymonadales bacterium]|nr:MAG: copper chaperone [Bradymonadales bacterium]